MRTSLVVAIGLVSLVGSVIGACAKGSSGTGSGGEGGEGGEWSGPGPASNSSSSASGMGGMGGMGGGAVSSSGSGAGSSSSSSSSASGSGGGGACGETPCKLVSPQCGCAAGEMCTIDGTDVRACVPAGSVPIGGLCDIDNDCAAGGICLATTPTISTCGEFCSTDAQCTAPGGLCVVKLNNGSGGQVAGVTLCSENCNATTNVGCAAGTGCTFGREAAGQMRLYTTCREAGSGTQNSACTDDTDCAATYGCFNTGSVSECLKYCNVNAASCPSGATCTPITIGNDQVEVIIGNVTYGACL
ncbi:hypothetical protein [Polyangium jinanense]|uniref:PE-PGRS family protein n=1 Tax=Polyangium jinanense TaxID=2829994 RepID=A0A9X3X6S2_9BACT|nr:hypothetical protein [Polyangium jinanense]MDC3956290.1 hypothetical protein [Polyangium jinanense]MDC3982426.1 hypothetical protein [Polyangium jinanense]